MYPVTIELLIDGAWCQGSHGKSEPLINPATEEVLATLPRATEVDLDRALAACSRQKPSPVLLRISQARIRCGAPTVL
jgi:succinate-semialdehyde dehydrogenase/glutarate-semialdehyde dehydrogenase